MLFVDLPRHLYKQIYKEIKKNISTIFESLKPAKIYVVTLVILSVTYSWRVEYFIPLLCLANDVALIKSFPSFTCVDSHQRLNQ